MPAACSLLPAAFNWPFRFLSYYIFNSIPEYLMHTAEKAFINLYWPKRKCSLQISFLIVLWAMVQFFTSLVWDLVHATETYLCDILKLLMGKEIIHGLNWHFVEDVALYCFTIYMLITHKTPRWELWTDQRLKCRKTCQQMPIGYLKTKVLSPSSCNHCQINSLTLWDARFF